VFSDPVAWRDGPPPPPPLEESARALLQSWGGVLEGAFPRQQSPEELQRIQEAAQRANKAKRRRWKCDLAAERSGSSGRRHTPSWKQITWTTSSAVCKRHCRARSARTRWPIKPGCASW